MPKKDVRKLTAAQLRSQLKKPAIFKKGELTKEFDRRVGLIYDRIEKEYAKKHGYVGDGVEYAVWQTVLGLKTEDQGENFYYTYVEGSGKLNEKQLADRTRKQQEKLDLQELKYYQDYILKNPGNKDLDQAYDGAGLSCFRLRKLEDAESFFLKAIKFKPKAIYYAELGDVRRLQGKNQEAVALYKKACNMDQDCKGWGASDFMESNNFSEAIELLEEEVRVYADDPYIWDSFEKLGDAYLGLQQRSKALTSYQEAVKRCQDKDYQKRIQDKIKKLTIGCKDKRR